MENEIEKCLMTKAYNKALNKNRKWNWKMFDEKDWYATKKWGDPLQRPHLTGDGAFSSEQISCTCKASL